MLSIIITWRNRPELQRALSESVPILSAFTLDWELLIVNGGGDLLVLQHLIANVTSTRIQVIDVPSPTFNKAECINIGVAQCRGDIVLLLDADIIIEPSFPQVMMQALDDTSFVTVKTVFETMPAPTDGFDPVTSFLKELIEITEFVGKDGRRASCEFRRGLDGSRCGPGIILVHKNHFVQIHGFNSTLRGWGFEDYDFQLRLQFALGLTRKTLHFATHITHLPLSEKPQTDGENRLAAYKNYAGCCFDGTLEQDVQMFRGRAVQALTS